jgi:triosephosphate isomerase
MTTRRKLVAGNWKMNGLTASAAELGQMCDANPSNCDVLICPPYPLIGRFVGAAGNAHIEIGAQDCHTAESGAHTGDVSAALLADVGATAVIVGHSERRADHGESSALVRAKAEAATTHGLTAIICVGETLEQREAGGAEELVVAQMLDSVPDGATAANTVIAYEPVWAIGTGKVPTSEQIGAMHAALRAALVEKFGEGDGMRILYGGSVKPTNAAEIFAIADVDGGLIGGASLKATDFLGIVSAA